MKKERIERPVLVDNHLAAKEGPSRSPSITLHTIGEETEAWIFE